MEKSGKLILLATPIGNLGDISARMAEALRSAEVVYCEDTRHSRQLLSHLDIRGQKLVSLHEHNEAARIPEVIGRLEDGQSVVLISDAGMPVVSDPGQRLVAAATEAGLQVTAIPGPNAALMALAISGLPAERFTFEGFLPLKGRARTDRLQVVAAASEATILYESPQRVARTVADLAAVCSPDRQIALTRELTKLHEEVWRGSLTEAAAHLETAPPRGEYTLVLAGAVSQPELITDDEITTQLQKEMATGASRRTAVDQVSQRLNVQRKRVYALALGL